MKNWGVGIAIVGAVLIFLVLGCVTLWLLYGMGSALVGERWNEAMAYALVYIAMTAGYKKHRNIQNP